MELDLLEKVWKDREEQESQAKRVLSIVTYTKGNKGKAPMQDLPQAYNLSTNEGSDA